MIAITGGRGNIGRVIAQKAREKGLEVLTIGLSQTGPEEVHAQVDVTDEKAMAQVFEQYPIKTVVHLASLLNSASRKNPDRAVEVNVMGTLHLLRLCKEHGARLIFGSSFNAIGDPCPEEPNRRVEENTESATQEFYGATKRYIERLGIAYAAEQNADFVSARIPTVLGIGQASKNSPWRSDLYAMLKTGGHITVGFTEETTAVFAHVEDVAEAIVALAQKEALDHQVYNLPNDSYLMPDLKHDVEGLQPGIQIAYGKSDLTGAPKYVSWDRFAGEFPNVEYRGVLTRMQDEIQG